mmetsp:Transcript_129329/g.374513  ORF Transcript_129329/g.374513 Transcript_129329/m.374513 type:complete len:309 (-) Transcript_129329:49-975(-)
MACTRSPSTSRDLDSFPTEVLHTAIPSQPTAITEAPPLETRIWEKMPTNGTRCSRLPVSTSHNRTPSLTNVATFRPQGQASRYSTWLISQVKRCTTPPVVAFHIIVGSTALRDTLVTTKSVDSIRTARCIVRNLFKRKRCKTLPVVALQMIASRSEPKVINRSPSGKTCASKISSLNGVCPPTSTDHRRRGQSCQTMPVPPLLMAARRAPPCKNKAFAIWRQSCVAMWLLSENESPRRPPVDHNIPSFRPDVAAINGGTNRRTLCTTSTGNDGPLGPATGVSRNRAASKVAQSATKSGSNNGRDIAAN